MNKREFLRQRKPSWKRFEELVDFFGARVVRGQDFSPKRRARPPSRADRAKKTGEDEDEDDLAANRGIGEFSRLFREVSNDLATVRSRGWGEGLASYLNDLLTRGYNCFYTAPPASWQRVREYLTAGFPRLFRANAGYFFTAAALFFVPLAIAWTTVQNNPDAARRILSAQQIEDIERDFAKADKSDTRRESSDALTPEMPEPGERSGTEDTVADRPKADDPDSDPERWDPGFGDRRSLMFGFYIRNNVGIAFRVFALGVLLGVGTVYVLLYNGIVIGAVAGYVCSQMNPERFLTFVFSHGSFELTAIAVSGGAGLMLGNAIIHPGDRGRAESLATRALDAVQIALGAGVMLFIAAIIEAYWSPSPLPAAVKFTGGTILWLSVFLYLGLAGRGR